MQSYSEKARSGYNAELTKNARTLRKNMTQQERHLWFDYLRTHPIRFYRQRPIDRYIVDFYCNSARLAIELDGSQHYEDTGKTYDDARTAALNRYGIEVLRFSNLDVNQNFEGVCYEINRVVTERLKTL